MPKYLAKDIADAVSSQLQLQIGQPYQANVILPMQNRAYERVWNYTDWSSLTKVDTATVKAGTSVLVLPKKYGRLIYNLSTTQSSNSASYETLEHQLVSLLRMGRVRWLQEYDPAYNAAFLGEQCVLVQPATAQAPKVVSSSASDTSQKVHIEGWLNGEMTMATVTLTGATPVASSVQFDEITSIGKSGDTVGTITVTSNSGSVTYATMAPWERNPFYCAYQLDAQVSADTSVYIIARKRFVPFLHYMSAPFMDKIALPLIDMTTDLCMAEMRQQDYGGYFGQRAMLALKEIANEQTEPMEGITGRA